jgi:hypothetical protein
LTAEAKYIDVYNSDGRPCQARIELCSDGDTIAQVVEVYSEDGQSRPFFAVLDTPALSTMVRVVNVGDPSFPISACVEPFMVDADYFPPPRIQKNEWYKKLDWTTAL